MDLTPHDPRDIEEILDVEYITVEELSRLRPASKPLPSEGEVEDAECHNCGEPWNEDEWTERKLLRGPSCGETWKYRCPNCGFETFEIGT